MTNTSKYRGLLLNAEQRRAIQLEAVQELVNAVGTDDASIPTPILYSEFKHLAQCGFQLRGGWEGDDVFVKASWPAGWTARMNEQHPKIIAVVDDKGRTRGSIVYDADPFNRYAVMTLFSRYSWDICGYEDNGLMVREVYVYDRLTGKKVASIGKCTQREVVPSPKEALRVSECIIKLAGEAELWLDTHIPDWRDTSAHWGV